MSEYMKVLIVAGVVPCILSFWPPLGLYRNARSLLWSIALVVLLFGGWDIFAAYRGRYR